MTDARTIQERLREWAALHFGINADDKQLLKDAAAALDAAQADVERLAGRVGTLKLEAQGHAAEARTANSTIYEIYQVLSGGKGEPGNWNGAEPARAYVEASDSRLREAREVLAWYGEQARLARLIHSGGDAGRAALAADGGSRARDFLASMENSDA